MAHYDIFFSGQLTNGAVLDQVQQNLKQLLRADDKTIAILFSGKRVAIKKGVDEATAQKFKMAFAKAGAVIDLQAQVDSAAGSAASTPAPAPTPAPAAQPVAAAQVQSTPRPVEPAAEEVEGYMKAFAHINAPSFDVAPAGSRLKEAEPEVAPPEVNLEGITVAPVGSDMNQMDMTKTAVIPDTSHISLADE